MDSTKKRQIFCVIFARNCAFSWIQRKAPSFFASFLRGILLFHGFNKKAPDCSVMGNLSESEDCIREKRICFFDSRPCGPGPMGPMEPMGVIRVKRVFKKSPLGT